MIALGTAGSGAAQVQAPDTTGLPLPGAAGDAVGGGPATIVGCDNTAIFYSGGGPGGTPRRSRPASPARNGYGGLSVNYLKAEAAPRGLDGRRR